MSEPLDLEPIKKRRFSQWLAIDDRLALLAEVERLRGELVDAQATISHLLDEDEKSGDELARRDEQITAVRDTLDGLFARYTAGPSNYLRVLDLYQNIRAALDGP